MTTAGKLRISLSRVKQHVKHFIILIYNINIINNDIKLIKFQAMEAALMAAYKKNFDQLYEYVLILYYNMISIEVIL